MSEFCKMRGTDGPVYPLTTRKLRMGFVPCAEDGKDLDVPDKPKAEPKPKVAKPKPVEVAPVVEETPPAGE